MFQKRNFLLNIRECNIAPSDIKSLLEKERDGDKKITYSRQKALQIALASGGIFERYEKLVAIAEDNPDANILIDSGFGVKGLAERIRRYANGRYM